MESLVLPSSSVLHREFAFSVSWKD